MLRRTSEDGGASMAGRLEKVYRASGGGCVGSCDRRNGFLGVKMTEEYRKVRQSVFDNLVDRYRFAGLE